MLIRITSHWVLFLAILYCCLPVFSPALAGPPFKTDDADPGEYRHGEAYVATQFNIESDGSAGTLPHLEVNYGILADTQLHLLIPFRYTNPDGGEAHYGLGDTEVGIKYQLIHETDSVPAVAVFPLVEIPTGDEDRGLGNGKAQIFIPLWLQKSWGPWTSYGGGGYWVNSGEGNQDWWYFGWAVQRNMSRTLTLGAEIYYETADTDDEDDSLGFDVGVIVNLTESHHLLFSAGRDISGPSRLLFYMGYQWTFGP